MKTVRSVAYEILREILREARQFNPKEFRVVANPDVIDLLLDEESQHLAGPERLHRQADLTAGRRRTGARAVRHCAAVSLPQCSPGCADGVRPAGADQERIGLDRGMEQHPALHFDPLCGWCYGAGAVVAKLAAVCPGLQLKLWPCGMFSGAGSRAMDDAFCGLRLGE